MQLELPADSVPTLTILAASGKPNVRVLTFDGVELHRCEGITTQLEATR
jgi:hypothetical protein